MANARRGEIRYDGSCAACHSDLGATLVRDTGASPLRGEAFGSFIEGWEARRLFGEIKTTMPADDPSKQSDEAYLDILAYVF